MTHDYAKKPRRKKKAKSQVPGWVWLLTGVVVGLFIGFLFYLSDIKPVPAPEGILPKVSKPAPTKPAEKTSTTRFDFYTLLPEREVIVPEQQGNASNHKQSIRYILQAGSFRNSEDADRLRARLILLGLDAKMEAVTAGGDTWHRVQVGPFSSRSKMSKARSTLINNGIDTLLFKKKIEG